MNVIMNKIIPFLLIASMVIVVGMVPIAYSFLNADAKIAVYSNGNKYVYEDEDNYYLKFTNIEGYAYDKYYLSVTSDDLTYFDDVYDDINTTQEVYFRVQQGDPLNIYYDVIGCELSSVDKVFQGDYVRFRVSLFC